MESTLAFLTDLMFMFPAGRLTFANQPDVVDYVQNQPTGAASVPS